jgi:hypothetical protein
MKTRRVLAALLAMALVVVACGGDDATEDTGAGGEAGCERVIRFTFAPDPVWDYLNV